MEEIKLCPCCKGNAVLFFDLSCDKVNVVCVQCGLRTRAVKNEEKAIKLWNKRPKEKYDD
jgi:hypothetical protein